MAWLSDAILANRRYDAVVRDLIADDGLWTDHPAVNFLAVTIDEQTERPTPDRLAARVSRAFLGIRLDCAQCHDHPFQPWKQSDFRGLAAFFGGVHSDLRGIRDLENDYQPLDRKGQEPKRGRAVRAVPSRPAAGIGRSARVGSRSGSPTRGTRTLPARRSIASGRSSSAARWSSRSTTWPPRPRFTRPSSPSPTTSPPNGYDLHRLIRIIAATEAFRLDRADEEASETHEASWAVFPMTRLRPEQVAGAIFQAASLTTIGPQSHWFARLVAYTGRNDFVQRYGDMGEDEFDARGGTIPQRLLLMNGDVVREQIKDGPLSATSNIAGLARDDPTAVEAAYLTVLDPSSYHRGIGPLRRPPRGNIRGRTESNGSATSTGRCSIRPSSRGIIEGQHDFPRT